MAQRGREGRSGEGKEKDTASNMHGSFGLRMGPKKKRTEQEREGEVRVTSWGHVDVTCL